MEAAGLTKRFTLGAMGETDLERPVLEFVFDVLIAAFVLLGAVIVVVPLGILIVVGLADLDRD